MGIFAGIIPLFRSLVTLAVSQADFSLPSLHPKIPFPAAGFRRPITVRRPGRLGVWGGQKRRFEPGPQLSRIQSEGFELPAPFCWGITESLDSNAAWQTAFDGGAHEVWCEERERDRHVDLAHAALLT